jgi:uncharacterized protein YgbK (DUF1537 family)
VKLGVIADDVTGASDLADAVCDEGWSAAVVFGVPAAPLPDVDCVVVALKSRTAPVADAVAESVDAARRLLAEGAPRLYQKYCSTFDSTDDGNIGPVADALRDLLGGAVSVGTPATPRAGRTVYQGHLFVGRQLLAESPMRDHPLTPMRDSDLVRLLAAQTPAPVRPLDRAAVRGGAGAVLSELRAAGGHVVVDALDDADLDVLAAALARLDGPVLVGGAAGLAAALARVDAAGPRSSYLPPPAGDAGRLVVSGSCSLRTREQVADFAGPLVPLRAAELAADFAGTVQAVVDAVGREFAAGASPVLVSSTAGPEDRASAPAEAADLLERAAGAVAAATVRDLGVRRLLVAGGETSGAVVRALGLAALRVGPPAGPGLPWMVPTDDDRLALLLKSGNFGAVDLFTTAWEACP